MEMYHGRRCIAVHSLILPYPPERPGVTCSRGAIVYTAFHPSPSLLRQIASPRRRKLYGLSPPSMMTGFVLLSLFARKTRKPGFCAADGSVTVRGPVEQSIDTPSVGDPNALGNRGFASTFRNPIAAAIPANILKKVRRVMHIL